MSIVYKEASDDDMDASLSLQSQNSSGFVSGL